MNKKEVTCTECKVGQKQNANIVLVSDAHIGSPVFNEKLLDHCIDFIRKTRYTYWINMGDTLEVGTRTSPGSSLFDLQMRNEEQLDYAIEKFYPIRKKGIGIHAGNHDKRIDRTVGIDITKYMASTLNVPYLNTAAYHIFKVNDRVWKLFTTHGKSGATTERGKETAMKRLKENHEDADIYCMGHVHKLGMFEDFKHSIGIDEKTQTQRIKKYSNGHYIFAGHFMDYVNSYAQDMLLKPEPCGYPILTFRPNGSFECKFVWGHDIEGEV